MNKRVRLEHQQKISYDKAAGTLEPLQETEAVTIDDPESWTTKTTVLREVGPRSFNAERPDKCIGETEPVC